MLEAPNASTTRAGLSEASTLSFSKYEGLGNDFIVVEQVSELSAHDAGFLCDRRHGVGADGVLLVDQDRGHTRMRVFNADGSQPEMCGNGIRCVALHQLRKSERASLDLEIQTASGLHRCIAEAEGTRRVGRIEVFMRPASLTPKDLPLYSDEPWIGFPLEIQGHQLSMTAVSMGNPHIVTFDAIDENLRSVLGPLLQTHPALPLGANVGFASWQPEQRAITLYVFERGSGWTLACGTGACAAAVAAVETQRIPRGSDIPVDLPGGRLWVHVGNKQEAVRMAGPARHVFDGMIAIDEVR
ncbi:MAG: diaminopimelate epimerase [Myxococcales bacterium]|nr:diaminopimelate epimerase [Myxococcales bacterium]MCB9707509.1 diaminopimelate epimerase [Myxococcales bacterium]